MMRLDRTWIAQHIPHQGTMCLLDSVQTWDSQRISCLTSTHRDLGNPLRVDDMLGAVCGIEYCAQAMAVHGALLAGESTTPQAGYLVSVRNVHVFLLRLDHILSDLLVRAERITGTDTAVVYGFSLHADSELLLEGRASALFDVQKHQALSS